MGAICNEAKGYTRIYNCGIMPTTANFPDRARSTVTATGTDGCAGGLVGLLDDDSRVVNCFSYADVSSTGYAAGIVGNNTYASNTMVSLGDDDQARYADLRTMVVNCMFYGDINDGSSIWPVYGGTKITNAGEYAINNYNFYSDSCHFVSTFQDYNCSWPAKYDYLTRYEFLRYLLNSNRELCGWWVGAPSAPSTMATTDVQAVPKDASLMAKWVLDPSVAPFPILKPFGYYSSPINIDANTDIAIPRPLPTRNALEILLGSKIKFTGCNEKASSPIVQKIFSPLICGAITLSIYFLSVFGIPFIADNWLASPIFNTSGLNSGYFPRMSQR